MKKNGKGKEYNKYGRLKFEGKEYDYKGKLKFEGEYINGKRWDKGYNKKGKIDFELKEGNGKGKVYDWNGTTIWRNIIKRKKKWKRKRIWL